ncbi:uncharacterized protein SCHCODRAFT_02280053 [Schizophyllum commune H4-8]|uniref:Expressed protein n=1 Tax=Schizophyllum commune (strain H4-8 / FGSC 9210) TaxID=578458 RepID=D8Q5W1_SCHCM|nr:uncharacterized protein SCHCODRAFT_02280053 [Schizophyllum commune H4-8]KAI5892004.1 hypothetical protein SCHCODRAFT_02280053 [Schizophyllum commune H4-8]
MSTSPYRTPLRALLPFAAVITFYMTPLATNALACHQRKNRHIAGNEGSCFPVSRRTSLASKSRLRVKSRNSKPSTMSAMLKARKRAQTPHFPTIGNPAPGFNLLPTRVPSHRLDWMPRYSLLAAADANWKTSSPRPSRALLQS